MIRNYALSMLAFILIGLTVQIGVVSKGGVCPKRGCLFIFSPIREGLRKRQIILSWWIRGGEGVLKGG